ncbi:uncharacterized protein LOC108200561 [Daucus carota subsp. sativus]|uniref:uncharacterized protein LOC108200561 n=1 Tax=Daucus carota subsp. sativus TaxID=79200 RepID=UPI0030829545
MYQITDIMFLVHIPNEKLLSRDLRYLTRFHYLQNMRKQFQDKEDQIWKDQVMNFIFWLKQILTSYGLFSNLIELVFVCDRTLPWENCSRWQRFNFVRNSDNREAELGINLRMMHLSMQSVVKPLSQLEEHF